MINLSYDAISLFVWLKDEAIEIRDFQGYPSSMDAQSYLPMSYGAQIKALKELESSLHIETKKVDGVLYYKFIDVDNDVLSTYLDIYDGSGVIIEEKHLDQEQNLSFG